MDLEQLASLVFQIDYEIPTKFLETFAEDEAAKLLGKLGDYGEEMSALANEINISTGKVSISLSL